MVSFDGSARIKQKGGTYSAIVWKLPELKIVNVAAEYATDLTVNEAEYRGLLLGSISWPIRRGGASSYVVILT